jgi:hypothetical protein
LLRVVANLADTPAAVPVGGSRLLLGTGTGIELAADQVVLPGHAAAIIGVD